MRTRPQRKSSSVRFRHRRAYGRPWLEILSLIGIVVVLAVAGSLFLLKIQAFL
jgi:hypothetical protein